MKQVQVGDVDVLLARVEGTYHALHGHCTHYGAPLAAGSLRGGKVICPWHHACYDLRNGEQCEPPGVDSLPHYDVEIRGEDVIVRVPSGSGDRRLPEMVDRDDDQDGRTFVILGGGAAGMHAAQSLRRYGFRGRVVMITREDSPPYDRPNCSKEYLSGRAPDEWMFFRSRGFYLEHGIELIEKRAVTEVDASKHSLTFEDGENMPFDAILLCTGGRPRMLKVPGADKRNIYTLRSLADSRTLREMADRVQNVVVVGASFIGMEVAASMRDHGCIVTVVAPESLPFEQRFGPDIGEMVCDIHREKGVRFHLGRTVDRFTGDEEVRRVVLDDGEEIAADLVVVGVGVEPVTDYLRGVNLNEDGGVPVDDEFAVAEGVYAAGDIASFPYWYNGESVRIEHWRTAAQHGRYAAARMAGVDEPYRQIPFFWTVHFGYSIRYLGHIKHWERIIFDGSPIRRKFLAFYVAQERVLAVAGLKRDTEMAAIHHLMRDDAMPSPAEIEAGVDWVELAGGAGTATRV